jgi:hypothetical protein
MAGISDEALKTQYHENKYRFQKQELQNKEFSEGSELEMYEFKYRFDDFQIGRFWSVDPLASKYVYNSPYAFSENKVTNNIELEGLEAASVPTPLPDFMQAVQNEFNTLGRRIDNMFSHTTSDDHMTSKQNPAPNVEVKKSTETSSTQTLNFGAGDIMEHLTRTNTLEGGPSLKMEVKTTTDVSDKTTTTTKVGGVTFTGVETVSRTDATTTSTTTISGPVKLGDIPNATLSVGFTTDSRGLSTFTTGASGNGKVGNSTYGGGADYSESGKSGQMGSASASFSVYGERSTDSNTHRSTYTIKLF